MMPIFNKKMTIRIHEDSHVDHGIPKVVVDFILKSLRGRTGFFIETITLPEIIEHRHGLDYWQAPGQVFAETKVEPVPCGLHLDVPESEVHYAKRGDREYTSRLCNRPPRMVREVTVIAGLHRDLPDVGMILFTIFGGPAAPREPGDPSLEGEALEESKEFWKSAALSA